MDVERIAMTFGRILRYLPTRFAAAAMAGILAVVSGMLLPNRCDSQELHPDIPPHSHSSSADQGWTCNDGFKQVAGFCVSDTQDLASHAAIEVFDGQWRCRAGYYRTNGACVLPTAPDHATLTGRGDRWECDWGFRRIASRCEEINPPAHAYLDAAGRDWACFPGFERVAERCVRSSRDKPDAAAAITSP
jgi:hypothetical protein